MSFPSTRTTIALVCSALFLLSAGACRGKKDAPTEPVVEAPPPAPPPPPAEPEPPKCPSRDALVGTWHMVTQVAPESSPKMAGINGYYTLRVFAQDEACLVRVMVTKTHYGKGSPTTEQKLMGEAPSQEVDGTWKIPVKLGVGEDRTEMTLFVTRNGDNLQGWWHYAGSAWTRSPLFGILEARRTAWNTTATADGPTTQKMLACPLKGQAGVTLDFCG